jgi:diaminohydroxyphosphoribosylaminopyrimidine deaminase/5-amino-6-(5-phosphoribosylamino)uracil reductase
VISVSVLFYINPNKRDFFANFALTILTIQTVRPAISNRNGAVSINYMEINELYMRRALELARHGEGFASPNPMVGAVIVDASGKVIGEGWHRLCGTGHAEVNAVASVKDQEALRQATMYVTLEPCSHYGKTPPCAKLIIDRHIPRVVVATVDPFEKVSGRGIAMLRDAGVEVVTGVLDEESRRLNARFITAHTKHRPFVTLKWAQSADGWMDKQRSPQQAAARFSSTFTSMQVHRLRALHDAILVGSGTVLADDPQLNVRLWHSDRQPRPVILDSRQRVTAEYAVMQREPIIISQRLTIADLLSELYRQGITSLLVEGGSEVLHSFVQSGLWDAARVEIAPIRLGNNGRAKAPSLKIAPARIEKTDGNEVKFYSQNSLFDVKNL